MAFPSDTDPFILIGELAAPGDSGVYTEVYVGSIVGPDENTTLVSNAHTNYTAGRRAVLASLVAWGHYGSGEDQTWVASTSSATLVELVHSPIHASPGRTDYTVRLDISTVDVEVELYNATSLAAEDTATYTGGSGREWVDLALTRVGADGDDYRVILRMNKHSGQPTGFLYGMHVIEDETTT